MFGILLINNPKRIVLLMLTNVILQYGKIWHKNIVNKMWQIFGKTMIFGTICQIWHHLASLCALRSRTNEAVVSLHSFS